MVSHSPSNLIRWLSTFVAYDTVVNDCGLGDLLCQDVRYHHYSWAYLHSLMNRPHLPSGGGTALGRLSQDLQYIDLKPRFRSRRLKANRTARRKQAENVDKRRKPLCGLGPWSELIRSRVDNPLQNRGLNTGIGRKATVDWKHNTGHETGHGREQPQHGPH
jgi:hypothetical protein